MLLILRILRQLLPLLPERTQRFIWFYTVCTSTLALVDVAAIALLAIALGSMVAGADIQLPLIGAIPPESYVWFLLTISLLVIAKAILSLLLQWYATRRFALFELEIGDRLFDAYIRAPWTDRLSKNTAQVVRLADVGIGNTIGGFLLPVLTLPTLVVTSTSVVLVIVIAEPVTALITILYLGSLALVQARVLSKRAVQAGRVNRDYSFRVATLMTDMMSALKEITLRDKAREVAGVVHHNRIHSTRARANIHFIGAVPRFVLDAGLIGGFLLVG
ncbi:MAG: ABC transporter ATP-binding protein, partial [Microcella sp.]|nr:ABC transporter ATP-binding protein [Microcella sp.]